MFQNLFIAFIIYLLAALRQNAEQNRPSRLAVKQTPRPAYVRLATFSSHRRIYPADAVGALRLTC